VENKKENSIVKDAVILCAITLLAGLLLGFVNQITKEPIEAQKLSAKKETYQVVFSEAKDFGSNSDVETYVANSEEIIKESGNDYGKVTVDEMVEAKDETGNVIGYVVSSTSGDGYGGDIKVAVGVKLDGTVVGIGMLEINETAGLGMKAAEGSFKDQFKDKTVEAFEVVKGGVSEENQIDAISGATITSEAVTNAVNAAVYTANSYME
jgi:electron transport complex protein RnfG